MKSAIRVPTAAAIALLGMATSANAYEFGSPGWEQKPGILIGAAASAPPPGLYGFDQVFTYEAKLVGPGAPSTNGSATTVSGNVAAQGLLWVPGWNFLGASYDAVGVIPYVSVAVGSPVDITPVGIHNAFIAPAELSWKLGDSGFFVKTGLGMYVPTGTLSGSNGLASVGNPWWTFQPELVFSYLKNGWNLTANFYDEINTKNWITGYTSGDVFHAEFTATKTIGKWTFGPGAYYVGQVTNDTSSSFYNYAINVNRYNIWAVGGLVGYDFGPASVNVWALQDVSANASGGTPGANGIDSAAIPRGFTVFAQLNYRIWGPDDGSSTPKSPLIHK
jgi:hypothetical protein